MSKKISFIITDLSSGGAERVLSLIANYFAQHGFEVQIVALQDDLIDYPLDDKVRHIYIERKTSKRLFYVLERVYKLRKTIKDSDIVISFLWFINIYTIVATMFLRKKVIISDRSDPNSEVREGAIVGRVLRRFFYRFANTIVFQTPDAKKYYPSKIQKKGKIIPNPISPYLPKRYTGKRKKEIVAVCRLTPQKNLKMMIDAYSLLAQEYPEYQLIIYGEGPLRKELELYIEGLLLNDKVLLPGFKTNIHQKILESSIYISSSDYEGISNSMLEALAIGIPSVVTDCPVGGAKMFIRQNENGILVPVRDIEGMYIGMKKIIENKEFAEKISKNATNIREEINVEVICKQWLDLI